MSMLVPFLVAGVDPFYQTWSVMGVDGAFFFRLRSSMLQLVQAACPRARRSFKCSPPTCGGRA